MKLRKTLFTILLFLGFTMIPINASAKELEDTIFMGEVQEVNLIDNKYIKVRAKGYLKGCTVYIEELEGIVGPETILVKDSCKVGNEKEEKVDISNIKIEKGDLVYMKLSPAMTKSIPPQSSVMEISINKVDKSNSSR